MIDFSRHRTQPNTCKSACRVAARTFMPLTECAILEQSSKTPHTKIFYLLLSQCINTFIFDKDFVLHFKLM